MHLNLSQLPAGRGLALRRIALRGALGAAAITWGVLGGPAAFAHGAHGAHTQGNHGGHESHSHTLNGQTHLVHLPKGTATLSWNPTSHALTVSISMTGLSPNSSSPAQIQQGACDNGGPVVDPLNPVAADAGGKGTSQTTLSDANVAQGMRHDWSIGVHSPTSNALMACGQVHGAHHLRKHESHAQTMPQTETITLHGTNRPNQNVGGDAHLQLDNGTLIAKLNVEGLSPNSTHDAGIYQGTCASQGALVHALDPLHANAGGHATSTTSISGVTTIPGDWYVAVWADNGTDLLACGDVHGAGHGDKQGN
jgi:hypothetical protein